MEAETIYNDFVLELNQLAVNDQHLGKPDKAFTTVTAYTKDMKAINAVLTDYLGVDPALLTQYFSGEYPHDAIHIHGTNTVTGHKAHLLQVFFLKELDCLNISIYKNKCLEAFNQEDN